jgi:hypothetical protein
VRPYLITVSVFYPDFKRPYLGIEHWNRKPLLSPNLLWSNLFGPSSHSGTVEGIKVSQFESDVCFFHIVRTRKTGPRKTKNIDENILSSAFLSRPYLWFGPTNANSRLYRRVGKDSLKRPQQESGEGQHDVPWSELACGCLFPLQNGLDIEDIEGMLDS